MWWCGSISCGLYQVILEERPSVRVLTSAVHCHSVRPLLSAFQKFYNLIIICIQYPGWITSCFCFLFGKVRIHVLVRNLAKRTGLIIPFGRYLVGIYDSAQAYSTLTEFLYCFSIPPWQLCTTYSLQFPDCLGKRAGVQDDTMGG